jgi:hypothetical protein
VSGTSFAPTFWAVFFGSFVAFLFLCLWQAGSAQRRAIRHRRDIDRGEGLIRIARAVGGAVYCVPAFPSPYVLFLGEDVLSYFYQWMLPPAQIMTTLESRAGFPGFLEATTRRSQRPPSRSRRFKDLTNVEGFDIVATDPGWATRMLKEGLHDILRSLREEMPRARLTLAADRFSIEIEDRVVPYEARVLLPILKRLAWLSRTAPGTAGVKVLGEVAVAEHGRCPVCCQTVATAELRCRLCKAPHHADCWMYLGRCAIFGCRGAAAISASRG